MRVVKRHNVCDCQAHNRRSTDAHAALLYGTSVQVHWTLAVLRSQSCLGGERRDSNRRQTDSTNSDKLINLTLSPSRSCTCPSFVSAKATVELNMHVVLREGCPVPPSSLRNLALSWALLMPFQAATTTEQGGCGRCYQGTDSGRI